MPASTCSITLGTDVPVDISTTLVDEVNVLVNSCTVSASRDETEYTNPDGCVTAIKMFNPKLEWSLSGNPLARTAGGTADFSNVAPGTQVGTGTFPFANFGTTEIFGQEPTDGMCIAKEPSLSSSKGSDPEMSWTVTCYPHIA